MGTLPTNRIRKVKLTNNTEYDLIPSMLQDGTTNNKLSVPTLSSDDTIVTTNTTQTIDGRKTFDDIILANSIITISNEFLSIQSDNHSTYTGDDWDTQFYSDKINISNQNDGNETTLLFPYFGSTTKTLAVTSDIQNVEIVDLTLLNA